MDHLLLTVIRSEEIDVEMISREQEEVLVVEDGMRIS